MRLLVDNQLPIALARYLETLGWTAIHVAEIGLASASDKDIWEYAIDHNMVIVSKDQDFPKLANLQGGVPPQVVWVRLGNCRRDHLFQVFSKRSDDIRRLLSHGAQVVELR